MTVEQREQDERLEECRPKVLSKVRSYLRSNFPGEDAKVDPDGVKRLLLQVAMDWCINRGVRMGEDELRKIVDEGYSEHCRAWQGKQSGSDPSGRKLGAGGKAFSTGYCV